MTVSRTLTAAAVTASLGLSAPLLNATLAGGSSAPSQPVTITTAGLPDDALALHAAERADLGRDVPGR